MMDHSKLAQIYNPLARSQRWKSLKGKKLRVGCSISYPTSVMSISTLFILFKSTMKTSTCLLLLPIALCHLCLGQQYNYFEGYNNLPVSIDTSQHNNLWEIGPPQSPQSAFFSSALSLPNAIVTDLDSFYSHNNHSTFEITINDPSFFWYYPYMIVSFRHRMNVNPDHAGGWIEASYDGGISWSNIYTDSVYHITVLDHSPMDTLFNGEIGFATNSQKNNSDWQYTNICYGLVAYQTPQPPIPDSILMRFHFASDSVGYRGDGWMIDDMYAFPEITHTAEELREMADGEVLVAHPNPVVDEMRLFYQVLKPSEAALQLIDMQGKTLYTDELGLLPRGMFSKEISIYDLPELPPLVFVVLELDGRRLTQKLVIR